MANTSLLGSYGGQDNSALMFRNRIINGDMQIDQRNAGASVTPASSTYTLDRWRFGCPSARMSVQRNASGVTPPEGFRNYIGLTTTSAYTPTANEAFSLQQFIEGSNVGDLMLGTSNAKTVTLSFWVRSSLTGTFAGSLTNENGGTRSYPFTYSISVANTWEFKTIVVPGDVTGTWGTGTGTGLGVIFSLGAGSNFAGTAGAWANGDLRTVSGAVSVVGTLNATFYITGVQLEAGAVATPFERRPFGIEQNLCMRYYEKTPNIVTTQALTSIPTSGRICFVPFLVQKRITPPTITVTSNAGTANVFTNLDGYTDAAAGSASLTGEKSVYGFTIQNGSAGALSSANNRGFGFLWSAEAEL